MRIQVLLICTALALVTLSCGGGEGDFHVKNNLSVPVTFLEIRDSDSDEFLVGWLISLDPGMEATWSEQLGGCYDFEIMAFDGYCYEKNGISIGSDGYTWVIRENDRGRKVE